MEFEPATLDEAAQVIHSFKCKVALRLNVEGIDWEGNDVLVFDLSDMKDMVKVLLHMGLTQKNAGLSYEEGRKDVVIYKQSLPGDIGVDQ